MITPNATILGLVIYGLTPLIVFVYPYFHSNSQSTAAAVGKFLMSVFLIAAACVFVSTFDKDSDEAAFYGILLVVLLFGFMAFTAQQYFGKKKAGFRRAGARKMPINFGIVFSVGVGISFLLMLFGYWNDEISLRSLLKMGALIPITFSMWRYTARFEAQTDIGNSPNPVLPQDGILYIRSFKTEAEPFWSGSTSDSPIDIPAENTQQFVQRYTFTEFLNDAFSTRIAPIIGLGNPLDTLPTDSIEMIYGQDGAWQQNILTMLERCNAVVMKAGVSSNLDWELSQILAQNGQEKFFIFTAPTLPLAMDNFLEKFSFSQEKTFDWQDLVVQMTRLGYKMPAENPGLGAIIAFNQAAEGTVVMQGANTPEDYVNAVYYNIH